MLPVPRTTLGKAVHCPEQDISCEHDVGVDRPGGSRGALLSVTGGLQSSVRQLPGQNLGLGDCRPEYHICGVLGHLAFWDMRGELFDLRQSRAQPA